MIHSPLAMVPEQHLQQMILCLQVMMPSLLVEMPRPMELNLLHCKHVLMPMEQHLDQWQKMHLPMERILMQRQQIQVLLEPKA